MGLCAPARNLYRPVSVTLRLKLFVLIGGLLALMVGAEWLLIETLTKDLRVEVSAVATSVGKDIVRILHPVEAKSPALPAPAAGFRTIVIRDETHVVSSTKTWTTAGGTGFLFIEGPAARTRIPIPETGVRGAAARLPDDPGAAEVVPELHAALHALVVNAVEASPDGAEISVRVQARDGGSARVTVDDEGPGLPGEVRARLFTPHVTTKPSGSGMGLLLAHRIATTRYGGGLALEERLSRGTRAVLDLGPRTGGRPA